MCETASLCADLVCKLLVGRIEEKVSHMTVFVREGRDHLESFSFVASWFKFRALSPLYLD